MSFYPVVYSLKALAIASILVVICSFQSLNTAPVYEQNQRVPDQVQGTELSVLTYNTELLPRLFSPFTKFLRLKQGKRARWIIEYLRDETDYDVVILQEVFAKPLCRKIKKALLEKYPYQVVPKTKRGKIFKGTNGLLLLSKYPIVDQEVIFFEESVGFDGLSTKGAVWAEIVKDVHTFQFLGTHMQSQHSDKAQAAREAQLQQMRALIDRRAKEGIPVILGGDFNVPRSHNDWYARFLELINAEVVELDDPAPFTFDVGNHWVFDEYSYKHEQLDYVLFRNDGGNCVQLEQKIIRPWKMYKGEKLDLSDHYGVTARFFITN